MSRIIAASLLLAGCALTDPYQRPGNWYPLGVNAENLTLMVANPNDLREGQPLGPADGQLAAAAVERLRRDKVKSLPDSGVADVQPVATNGNGPVAAGSN